MLVILSELMVIAIVKWRGEGGLWVLLLKCWPDQHDAGRLRGMGNRVNFTLQFI